MRKPLARDCLISSSESRICDQYGYLTNVYTVPDRRSHGLGAELQRHIIDLARAEGLELLVVWPSDLSRSFYERLGFSADNQVLEMVLWD